MPLSESSFFHEENVSAFAHVAMSYLVYKKLRLSGVSDLTLIDFFDIYNDSKSHTQKTIFMRNQKRGRHSHYRAGACRITLRGIPALPCGRYPHYAAGVCRIMRRMRFCRIGNGYFPAWEEGFFLFWEKGVPRPR